METVEEEDPIAKADAGLAECRERMERVMRFSRLSHLAIGTPGLDRKLQALGRAMLSIEEQETPADAREFTGPDVYLATHLESAGGHTRLMGDFFRALGGEPRLFLTDLYEHPEGAAGERAREGLDLSEDRLSVLRKASPGRMLTELIGKLRELRPARLFLFHHPGDVIAVAAAQSALAGRVFVVHHADNLPCLGLHIAGALAIELHPYGAALSAVLGINRQMLPLTCPDPGARPHGFRRQPQLVTASSGREEKFQATREPTYRQAVAAILRFSEGRHVHIGPLSEEGLETILKALDAAAVPRDRFVHVPWAPSLARALWEHEVDVFLASFPIDGARTSIEVAASGTPILNFASQKRARFPDDPFRPTGALRWGRIADLIDHLRECQEPGFLEERSRQIREFYEQRHHPRVFAEVLRNIPHGDEGVIDPLAEAREMQWLTALVRPLALQGAEDPGQVNLQKDLGDAREHITAQAEKIRFLEEKRRDLTGKLKDVTSRLRALEKQEAARQQGGGLRRALRRWLLRP